jgi:hypothetical protein
MAVPIIGDTFQWPAGDSWVQTRKTIIPMMVRAKPN